jgi:uncharacterized protein (DUF1697 family)
MRTHVAFVRAVNVGWTGKLPMADLKALLEEFGFEEVKTVLQSGSAVFKAKGDSAKIGDQLTRALADRFDLKTEVIVRTAAQWAAAIEANPYPQAARDEPARMHIMPLSDAPGGAALADLLAAIKGRETVELVGANLYAVYPDGSGESKLTLQLIEKKLGVRATARNWNTALKIAALFEE